MHRMVALVVLAGILTSCSYSYPLLAVSQGRRLAFIVDPKSGDQPSCFREIEVLADAGAKAKTAPERGDDVSRVGYGTYWFESVDYNDDCANRFPIQYGAPLKAQHQQDGLVRAKPLRREVVYVVSTTTEATGYGEGRFIIHGNGHIENLPRGGVGNLLENAN